MVRTCFVLKHTNFSGFAFQKPLILHVRLLLSHRRMLFWNYIEFKANPFALYMFCVHGISGLLFWKHCVDYEGSFHTSPSFLSVITKRFLWRLRHFSLIGPLRAQFEFLEILQGRARLLSCPGQLGGVPVHVSFNFPNFRHSVILDFLANNLNLYIAILDNRTYFTESRNAVAPLGIQMVSNHVLFVRGTTWTTIVRIA